MEKYEGQCKFCKYAFNKNCSSICKGWKPIRKKDIPFSITMIIENRLQKKFDDHQIMCKFIEQANNKNCL